MLNQPSGHSWISRWGIYFLDLFSIITNSGPDQSTWQASQLDGSDHSSTTPPPIVKRTADPDSPLKTLPDSVVNVPPREISSKWTTGKIFATPVVSVPVKIRTRNVDAQARRSPDYRLKPKSAARAPPGPFPADVPPLAPPSSPAAIHEPVHHAQRPFPDQLTVFQASQLRGFF